MEVIYTLGYEGLSLDQFLARLRAANIEMLIDVRQIALSRKAGFSKTPLSRAAGDAGIRYVYEPSLGCPRDIRYAYREQGDWKRYTRDYTAHLRGQQAALDRVRSLAANHRVCLVCFEANPMRCHRSLVAAAITELEGGGAVVDLRSPTATS